MTSHHNIYYLFIVYKYNMESLAVLMPLTQRCYFMFDVTVIWRCDCHCVYSILFNFLHLQIHFRPRSSFPFAFFTTVPFGLSHRRTATTATEKNYFAQQQKNKTKHIINWLIHKSGRNIYTNTHSHTYCESCTYTHTKRDSMPLWTGLFPFDTIRFDSIRLNQLRIPCEMPHE